MDTEVSKAYRGKSAAERSKMRRAARLLLHTTIYTSGPAGLSAWGVYLRQVSKDKEGGTLSITGPCGTVAVRYKFFPTHGYGTGTRLLPWIDVNARHMHACLGFEKSAANIWWYEVYELPDQEDLLDLMAVSQGYYNDLYLIENGDVLQVSDEAGWLRVSVRRKGSQVVEVLSLCVYLKQIRS